jgi:hypothetical protein
MRDSPGKGRPCFGNATPVSPAGVVAKARLCFCSLPFLTEVQTSKMQKGMRKSGFSGLPAAR